MDNQLSLKLLFELFRAEIAQRQMTTLTVIPTLNVGKNGVFGFVTGSIMGALDQFSFERTPKTLHWRVIVAAADPAEAD